MSNSHWVILSIRRSVSTNPVRLFLRNITRDAEIMRSAIDSNETQEVAPAFSEGQVAKLGDLAPSGRE